jgi:hypothetical protein
MKFRLIHNMSTFWRRKPLICASNTREKLVPPLVHFLVPVSTTLVLFLDHFIVPPQKQGVLISSIPLIGGGTNKYPSYWGGGGLRLVPPLYWGALISTYPLDWKGY